MLERAEAEWRSTVIWIRLSFHRYYSSITPYIVYEKVEKINRKNKFNLG